MSNLILISILLVAIVAPTLAARDRSPRRGVKRLILALAVGASLYVAVLLQYWSRNFIPMWSP